MRDTSTIAGWALCLLNKKGQVSKSLILEADVAETEILSRGWSLCRMGGGAVEITVRVSVEQYSAL